MSYEQQFVVISKLLGRDIQTLKRVGRSPKSLSRFEYITELLPHIDKYMATDKADGIRSIIEIDKGLAKCVVGSEYFEIKDISATNNCIIDCEVLMDKKMMLIYDILAANESLISKSFAERYQILSKLAINHPVWKFKIKKFATLTVATYQKEIMSMHNAMKKYPYKTDGIIFTRKTESYLQTTHYKWKPPEHQTIDFLVINGKNNLELWSGISRRVFKQIGLTLPADYGKKTAQWTKISSSGQLANEFFPVPFMPSIAPFAYQAPIKDAPPNLAGQVAEFSWINKAWHFHRIRDDRIVELAEGHYFGNNFEIAELTYELIMNPLMFKDLIAPMQTLTKNFYFEKSDAQYKAARNFNSYVKSQLISRNYGTEYVIDMASGKGQDLNRYYSAKVKNLLMLEIDQSALDELITRKYDMAKKLWIERIDQPIVINSSPQSTKLVVAQMDLNKPAKNNIVQIETEFIDFKAKSVGLIVCNFALHYLVADTKHISNVATFIAHWLKPGGEFMFTALDTEKINALLKKGPWEIGPYKIEYAKKKTAAIKVLLPCSTEMREEPQINLSDLDKELAHHKILRIETKSFGEYLSQYKDVADLNDADRQFVSLYQYCIYKKIE